MRRTALALALLASAGCATRSTDRVATRDLLGPYRIAVHADRAATPLAATTCILEAAPEALPAEALPLVASLLERRGWTVTSDPLAADATFHLSDGTLETTTSSRTPQSTIVVGRGGGPVFGDMRQGFNGSGDILYRNNPGRSVSGGGGYFGPQRAIRRLEVAASVGTHEDAWHGLAWIDAQRGEYLDDLNDLALALADRFPAPNAASGERAAVDRLGTDFVTVLDTEQRLVPVLLAVAPGGVAARAGWSPRDVLLEIDGVTTSGLSWQAVARHLAAAESKAVEVELRRNGERYLTFLVPAGPRPVG